jgi:hypothetical protein
MIKLRCYESTNHYKYHKMNVPKTIHKQGCLISIQIIIILFNILTKVKINIALEIKGINVPPKQLTNKKSL